MHESPPRSSASACFFPGCARPRSSTGTPWRRCSSSSSWSATGMRRSTRCPSASRRSSAPRALLLDEPSAGLNREEREDLARYILRIKHELGIAMVWVEHDMQMVADLADRILVLNYGLPLAEGRPHEVLADPRVIDAYLGARPVA